MSKVYRLSSAGKAQLVRRTVLLAGVSGIVGLGLAYWNLSRQTFDPIFLTVVLLLVGGGFMALLYFTAVRQQRALLDSIQIVLGEDFIVRRQANTAEVRVRRPEVTGLRETPDGLCVLTSDPRRTLLVPRQLAPDDYQSLRTALEAWAPLQPATAQMGRMRVVATVGFVAALAILWLSTNLWLVMVLGLALLAYYLYLAWTIHKSEGVDPRTRRSLWMMPAFVAFLTGMKVCVLTNAFVVIMEALVSAGR